MQPKSWGQWWKRRGAQELRQLAWDHWDPIGLRDAPGAPRDEYDAYLGPVASYLRSGSTVDEIACLLDGYQTLDMGLGSSLARNRAAAQAMLDWYAVAMLDDGKRDPEARTPSVIAKH